MKTMRIFLAAGLLMTGAVSFAQAQARTLPAPSKVTEVRHGEMSRKGTHNPHKLCVSNPHSQSFPQRMERIHEPIQPDNQRKAVPVPKR